MIKEEVLANKSMKVFGGVMPSLIDLESLKTEPIEFKSLKTEYAAATGDSGSLPLFEKLFTKEVEAKFREIKASLLEENPILNPDRQPPLKWNEKLPGDDSFTKDKNAALERERNLIMMTMAMDAVYAPQYKEKQGLIAKINEQSGIMSSLAVQGRVEHIENEDKKANYHRGYHPQESAKAAVKVADLIAKENRDAIKGVVAAAFEHHDIDQGHVKVDGVNEIKSANRLAANWEDKLNAFQEKNAQNPKPDLSQADIEEYKNLTAYAAWKTVVAGTTMMKMLDGQPTIHVAQQLIEQQMGWKKQETILDDASFIMSMVDSNLPALAHALKTDEDLGPYLPDQFLREDSMASGLIELCGTNDGVKIAEAGLAFGQNGRMFPEIHVTYGAALTKAVFDNGMDGVTAWNQAVVAARKGDNEELKKLLSATMTAEVPVFMANPLQKGSTLMDIFIHRIGSELMFSKGQGPEYYQQVASTSGNLDLGKLGLNENVWKEHLGRLERLRDTYNKYSANEGEDEKNNDKNQEAKFKLAETFFHLVGNQPGVFLKKDETLQKIEERMVYLEQLPDKKSELEALQAKLQGQKEGEGIQEGKLAAVTSELAQIDKLMLVRAASLEALKMTKDEYEGTRPALERANSRALPVEKVNDLLKKGPETWVVSGQSVLEGLSHRPVLPPDKISQEPVSHRLPSLPSLKEKGAAIRSSFKVLGTYSSRVPSVTEMNSTLARQQKAEEDRNVQQVKVEGDEPNPRSRSLR